jgi:Fe-S-cluster containining protein
MLEKRVERLHETEKKAFDCLRCGRCCQGQGGIVASLKDIQRLCGYLRMTAAEFEKTYGRRRGKKLHIRTGRNTLCIFFDKDTGCTVHEAKPDICRAWPYFRGNLLDAASLELCKEYCPGIPASVSHTDFISQGAAWLLQEQLVGTAGADEANALQLADLLIDLAKVEKKR